MPSRDLTTPPPPMLATQEEAPARERDPKERKTLEDALHVATETVDRAADGATVDADLYVLAAGFLVLCGDMAAMLDAAKKATHFCGWCQRANADSRVGLATYSIDEVREHTQRCEHNPIVAERDALRAEVEQWQTIARESQHQWDASGKKIDALGDAITGLAMSANKSLRAERDSLRARLALVEPMVEAAKRWRQCDEAPLQAEPGKLVVTKICNHDDLADAIDALLAAEEESR